jgi:hypothetical protein
MKKAIHYFLAGNSKFQIPRTKRYKLEINLYFCSFYCICNGSCYVLARNTIFDIFKLSSFKMFKHYTIADFITEKMNMSVICSESSFYISTVLKPNEKMLIEIQTYINNFIQNTSLTKKNWINTQHHQTRTNGHDQNETLPHPKIWRPLSLNYTNHIRNKKHHHQSQDLSHK